MISNANIKNGILKAIKYAKNYALNLAQRTVINLDLHKSILQSSAKIHASWKMVPFGLHGWISLV